MAEAKRIGLDWPLTSITGWGIVGLYLVLALRRRGGPLPVLFRKPREISFLDPLRVRALAPLIQAAEAFDAQHVAHGRPPVDAEFPVLHAMSGDFVPHPGTRVTGHPDVGLVVLEDTQIGPAARDRARAHSHVVAASRWAAEVLGAAKIGGVGMVHQGIDPSLFHPAPQARPFGDRFVVFSGGKIELRKGQDLVIAAFRRFHARHPDAMLLTCWQNPWPATAGTIVAAGLVAHAPAPRQGLGIDVAAWTAGLGLPEDAVFDVDFVPNGLMPAIVREADVALFPNRCEGGTNLVAMECLAAGVPTILSANTGHLDLLAGPDVAIALGRQGPVRAALPIGTDGWGESDVEEIDAALEAVYRDRPAAAARAARAAAWMAAEWSWDRHADRLLAAIGVAP